MKKTSIIAIAVLAPMLLMAAVPSGLTQGTPAVDAAVAPGLSVGRIFKLTGPAFVGNRLVLRAKPSGPMLETQFAWKRDGEIVATTERLDIPALTEEDFGTYTLTVTTQDGEVTSKPYVLEESKSGIAVGWGASDHGRTDAPADLTGLAQIASGMNFNLGLKTDGTVAAWGYNGHGGCDVPDGLGNVSFVAAGGYESQGAGFAVKTDGTVAAWGQPALINTYWNEWANYNEQTREYSGGWVTWTNGWDTVATMPNDLADVVQVAVGAYFAIALKADGSVVAWGQGDEFGWDWNKALPYWAEDVVAIAAGGDYAVVLLADGTAFPIGPDFSEPSNEQMVIWTFDDSVVIGSNASSWTKAIWAIKEDGWIAGATCNDYGYGLADAPYSNAGMAAVDGGQYHAMALDAEGNVLVWGGTWYGQDEIPSKVQGNAFAIAAGGYHCTALLPDADGDTISDAEEALIGRDPLVAEPATPEAIAGKLTIDGDETPAAGATISLFNAAGECVAAFRAGDDGAYSFDSVIPGRYFVKIEAEGAVDEWLDGIEPAIGADAPFSTFESDSGVDFDLKPGQGVALAEIACFAPDGDKAGLVEVKMPDGAVAYLDMWPVAFVADNTIDIGEIPASHAGAASHSLTLKLQGEGAPVPAPAFVEGVESDCVAVQVAVGGDTGSLMVSTEPAGAEVYVDYADAPLGVTPLTVGNLLAGSHSILLKKDGFLRPRPVVAYVSAGETREIQVPLASADDTEGMSVAVSCVLPNQAIYIDYLPTGEMTPAVIGGMDPASHAGTFWHSASHSILLRHEMVRPWAPRYVPEPEIDPETEVPTLKSSIDISGPQLYDDSDGDGIRNDEELANEANPFSHKSAVSFDNGMGEGGATEILVFEDDMPPTVEVPVLEDYRFDGYWDAENGCGTQYFDTNGVPVRAWDKTDEAVTLYAAWTPLTYMVFFGANGGTGEMPPQKILADSGAVLPANEFVRSGYDFAGWAVSPSGSARYADRATVTNIVAAGGTIVLYAEWIPETERHPGGDPGSTPDEYVETAIYRMRNPFTGEYLYSGSEVEMNAMVQAGWVREGVIFWALAQKYYSTVPLYRLRNPVTGSHLFTTVEAEKDILVGSYGWIYEGVVCYVDNSENGELCDSVAVFRLRDATTGQYVLTANEFEKAFLEADPNWSVEGVAFWATRPNCTITIVDEVDNSEYSFSAAYGDVLPNIATPSRPGLLFGGYVMAYWLEGDDGTAEYVEEEVYDNLGKTYWDCIGDMRLYAVWLEPAESAILTPVYRLRSLINGEYFFTKEIEECDALSQSDFWVYEGEAFKASTIFSEGTIPLYRLSCPSTGDRLFSATEIEKNALVASGYWNCDGIVCFVGAPGIGGEVAVSRLCSPWTGLHIFTATAIERDALVTAGWIDEGVAFQVWQ